MAVESWRYQTLMSSSITFDRSIKILQENEHLKLLGRKFTPKILRATSIFCRRVAQELGVSLGEEVGYAIRFEDCDFRKDFDKVSFRKPEFRVHRYTLRLYIL